MTMKVFIMANFIVPDCDLTGRFDAVESLHLENRRFVAKLGKVRCLIVVEFAQLFILVIQSLR